VAPNQGTVYVTAGGGGAFLDLIYLFRPKDDRMKEWAAEFGYVSVNLATDADNSVSTLTLTYHKAVAGNIGGGSQAMHYQTTKAIDASVCVAPPLEDGDQDAPEEMEPEEEPLEEPAEEEAEEEALQDQEEVVEEPAEEPAVDGDEDTVDVAEEPAEEPADEPADDAADDDGSGVDQGVIRNVNKSCAAGGGSGLPGLLGLLAAAMVLRRRRTACR